MNMRGLEDGSAGFEVEVGGYSLAVTPEYVVNLLVIACIYAYFLSIFTPELMLSQTITSGGDTASHYYPAKFLRDELLPKGHVIGWLPGWYGGMPLFQYYFPVPFLLIAVLGYIIPLQISFKLVSALGVFILPLCAFYCMKLMRFRFPTPVFAAIFTLPFLFMESHSMWGGNIPSTLAGEFSYSISLSLTVLFFGAIYIGLRERRYVIHNIILLASVALTHVYTVLWVVASSTFLLIPEGLIPALLSRKDVPPSEDEFDVVGEEDMSNSTELSERLAELKDRILYMVKTYPLAFMLTGFWIVPLLIRLKYTTSYDIPWNITEDVMPPILWPFVVFSGLGVIYSLLRGEHRIGFFIYSIVTSLIFFFFASKLGVVDIRFLPFVYVTLMLLAAYGLTEVIRSFRAKWAVPMIVLILTLFWVNSNKDIITGENDTIQIHTDKIMPNMLHWKYGGFTPYWVSWNYEGFEKKPLWPQFNATNAFIKGGFGDARAQFEHNDQHNSAGTVRAFESIPLFAGRSILEGLYMQSIITSPFVFYMQSEFSEQQSCPFWAVYPCTSFNLDTGTRHLKMFNVRYLVARSQKLKDAMRLNPEWALAFSDDPYEVWDLTTNPDHYVTVPKYEPVLYETSQWKNISYQWFKRMDLIDVPVVFKGSVDSQDRALFKNIVEKPTMDDLERMPRSQISRDCNVKEIISSDEIDFSTDCVGQPHIISISYYPSWHPVGADRVYMVSPSFMLVYPTENNVKIVYGKNIEDWVGILLTVSAAVIVIYALFAGDRRVRRFFCLT